MIRSEDAVVAMAMPSRRRHEVGESIEKLPRRERDDGVLPRAVAWRFRPGPIHVPRLWRGSE